MNLFYNKVAGKNLDRIAALSDGVFAIAMTLLVLDLHVPLGPFSNEDGLVHALLGEAHRLIPYAMTFLTLGIFWVGSRRSSTRWRVPTATSRGSTSRF